MKRRSAGSGLRDLALAIAGLAALGCQNPPLPPLVPDAAGAAPISAVRASCGELGLSQDCSNWWGPTRPIEIYGFRMKVAGSADGRTLLLSGPHPNKDTFGGSHGQKTNTAYDLLKLELSARGIQVESVTPVASAGALFGYVIRTSADAYTHLKELTVQ
jgi:hypothetical protein